MVPYFVDSNHEISHTASEGVVYIPESLCLRVYLAREDRNIPGI